MSPQRRQHHGAPIRPRGTHRGEPGYRPRRVQVPSDGVDTPGETGGGGADAPGGFFFMPPPGDEREVDYGREWIRRATSVEGEIKNTELIP